MIGIFDSGSGGLTILRACQNKLPDQSFLYLGDHARAPYGDRDNRDIVDYTTEMVDILFREGCRLVILACNTAAAVAARTIQQDWLPVHYPDRRVLGVIVPVVEALSGVRWRMPPLPAHKAGGEKTVGLFATSKTIESGSYHEEMHKHAPHCRMTEQACPGLVGAIEDGADEETLFGIVQNFTERLLANAPDGKIDSAVLGCTHFPLVEHLFRKALPAGTNIVSQPKQVANALADYLHRHPEFDTVESPPTSIRYLTTGKPERLAHLDNWLPGLGNPFEILSYVRPYQPTPPAQPPDRIH